MNEITKEIIIAIIVAIIPPVLSKIYGDFKTIGHHKKQVKDKEYHKKYVKPIIVHYFLAIILLVPIRLILERFTDIKFYLINDWKICHAVMCIILFIGIAIEGTYTNEIYIKLPRKIQDELLKKRILCSMYILFGFSILLTMYKNDRNIDLESIAVIVFMIIILIYGYYWFYHIKKSNKTISKIEIKLANSANPNVIKKDSLIDYVIKNGKINVRYKKNNTIKLCIYREDQVESIEVTYD